MELLYFISGVLTVGLGYGVWFFKQIKTEHQNLLSQNRVLEKMQDLMEMKMLEVGARVETVDDQNRELIDRINVSTFQSTTELKKRVDDFDILIDSLSTKVTNSNKLTEHSMSKILSDYQQVRSIIKSLKEDPNFLSRY